MNRDRLSMMPAPTPRGDLGTRTPSGNTEIEKLPSGDDTELPMGQRLCLSHRDVISTGAHRPRWG